PILTDDGIGIIVAREIAERHIPGVDVDEATASGIEVMEMMLDYEKVVIVDATMFPNREPGEIMRLKEEDFSHTVHGSSPHGVNLSTAIALGRKTSPERMPREIVFIAMQAEDVSTFSEKMTAKVEKRLPDFVDLVVKEIQEST
ncbi:MAG TPA: hydrogenase maturation protease, partial [Thermoplasmata archaeon]|nr:hydrogenase maturation protease [Thermoplasmata archaeon]